MLDVELRDMCAKVPMTKARRGQGEQAKGVHERVDPAITEAEPGRPLLVHEYG
jgi:hypothetical protein